MKKIFMIAGLILAIIGLNSMQIISAETTGNEPTSILLKIDMAATIAIVLVGIAVIGLAIAIAAWSHTLHKTFTQSQKQAKCKEEAIMEVVQQANKKVNAMRNMLEQAYSNPDKEDKQAYAEIMDGQQQIKIQMTELLKELQECKKGKDKNPGKPTKGRAEVDCFAVGSQIKTMIKRIDHYEKITPAEIQESKERSVVLQMLGSIKGDIVQMTQEYNPIGKEYDSAVMDRGVSQNKGKVIRVVEPGRRFGECVIEKAKVECAPKNKEESK